MFLRRQRLMDYVEFSYMMGFIDGKNQVNGKGIKIIGFMKIWYDIMHPYCQSHYKSLVRKKRKVRTLTNRRLIWAWNTWYHFWRIIFFKNFRKSKTREHYRERIKRIIKQRKMDALAWKIIEQKIENENRKEMKEKLKNALGNRHIQQ